MAIQGHGLVETWILCFSSQHLVRLMASVYLVAFSEGELTITFSWFHFGASLFDVILALKLGFGGHILCDIMGVLRRDIVTSHTALRQAVEA